MANPNLDLPDSNDAVALADWAERWLLLSDDAPDGFLTRAAVLKAFASQAEPDAAELDAMLDELRKRQNDAAGAYPFTVDDDSLSLDSEINSRPYELLSYLSMPDPPWAQAGDSEAARDALITLVQSAMGAWLGSFDSMRIEGVRGEVSDRADRDALAGLGVAVLAQSFVGERAIDSVAIQVQLTPGQLERPSQKVLQQTLGTEAVRRVVAFPWMTTAGTVSHDSEVICDRLALVVSLGSVELSGQAWDRAMALLGRERRRLRGQEATPTANPERPRNPVRAHPNRFARWPPGDGEASEQPQ